MNRVAYEWTVETLDGPDGDILEAGFYGSADDMMRFLALELEHTTFVRHGVVRRIADEDGEVERGYAYINGDGLLPDQFCNGDTIPKFIRNQLATAMKLHDAR